jgi:hypothetical protein
MITCPLCRRQYSESAHYCKYDGALLINKNRESVIPPQAYPALRSCGRCLAYYPGHFVFCPIHGTALDARSTAPEIELPQSPHLVTPHDTSELPSPRPTKPFSQAHGVGGGRSDEHAVTDESQRTSSDLTNEDVPTVLRKKPSKQVGPRAKPDALAHFLYGNADTATSDRNRLFIVSCVVIVLTTALFVYNQFSARPKEAASQPTASGSISKQAAGTSPQSSTRGGLAQGPQPGASPTKTKTQTSSRGSRNLRVTPRH